MQQYLPSSKEAHKAVGTPTYMQTLYMLIKSLKTFFVLESGFIQPFLFPLECSIVSKHKQIYTHKLCSRAWSMHVLLGMPLDWALLIYFILLLLTAYHWDFPVSHPEWESAGYYSSCAPTLMPLKKPQQKVLQVDQVQAAQSQVWTILK